MHTVFVVCMYVIMYAKDVRILAWLAMIYYVSLIVELELIYLGNSLIGYVSEIHNCAPLCIQLDNVYLKAWVFIFGNPIPFFCEWL